VKSLAQGARQLVRAVNMDCVAKGHYKGEGAGGGEAETTFYKVNGKLKEVSRNTIYIFA
jgi:dihydroxyacetone kinase DhaKLM complex PTS-EIIA-like component DhaM